MGWGDDVLTTGIVKKARSRGRPICVGDGQSLYWSPVFEGNPYISREIVPGCVWVKSAEGFRPYIRKIHEWGYEYEDSFKAEPGEIYLTEGEKDWPEGFIYIEPNIKGEISKNKDWGFEKWQEVARRIPARFIQGPGRKLDGVEQVHPRDFRHACGLLARCKAFVGTDGGLHHAAAALGKRAVVVWTGFSSPKQLGYDSHINLHSGKPCGKFADCDHCRKNPITVDAVVKAIESLLRPEL